MIKPRKDQTKMRIKPPGQTNNKEAAALEFISAAPGGAVEPQTSPTTAANEILPWKGPGVREDVVKQYNLRLPEPELLKLRFVVEKQRAKSINSYILTILLPQLDADVAELMGHEE